MKKQANNTEKKVRTIDPKDFSKAQIKCDINEYIENKFFGEDSEAGDEDGNVGKIYQIIHLHKAGYSRKEIIILAGFNTTTVHRQIGEFEKLRKGHIVSMCGIELYEARIARVMRSKKCTREAAIERIAEMDAE